ncbi:MAG: hydrogen peroxide-inducible genes activator [Pseudomonadota bacterium]
MPTLRQLRYLAALAQERHFRKAAERVNVTQPTLSTQLQELERTLQASLIDRSAKTVTLTPLGQEVLNRAQRVLADVQDIVDLAAASQHGISGTVKLGVAPTLGPYLLPFVVPGLHARYPDLKLYVREGKPVELQEQVKSGQLDLVVSPLPINGAELTTIPLFREPLLVAFAPDDPLAQKPKLKKTDLAGRNVLAIEPGHHLHDKVREICDTFGAHISRDYEGTSLDTLRLMVGMGVGIAFLPALYIRSEISNRGEVEVRELEAASLHRHIGIAWRERSVNAAVFEDIAQEIRTFAQDNLHEVTLLN